MIVLGAGAIGCGVAAALAAGGLRPLLVSGWAEHVDALRRDGLLVVDRDGGSSRVPVDATTTVELRAGPPVRLAYLAVKCDGTPGAVEVLRDVLAPDGIVVSMQNGVTVDELAEGLGARRVIGGSPNFSAQRPGPGAVSRMGGASELVVGELDGGTTGRVVEVARRTSACGWTTTVSDNIVGVLWSKLVANSVVNSLTVVGGWTVGQLMEDDTGRRAAVRMLAEGGQVARAAALRLAPMPTFDLPLAVAEAGAGDPAAERRLRRFGRLFRDARTSSLQDVQAGRRTELRHLTGRLVELGTACGVPTPVCASVLELALEVESGRRAPGACARELQGVL